MFSGRWTGDNRRNGIACGWFLEDGFRFLLLTTMNTANLDDIRFALCKLPALKLKVEAVAKRPKKAP